MQETFKAIPCFPRYSISNMGNVINNTSGKRISQRKASNGYMRFNVRRGGTKYEKPTTLHTHRVVAELFVENKDNKPFVNHIDGVKTHNDSRNLEWCTERENSVHAYKTIEGYSDVCAKNLAIAQEACKKPIEVRKDGILIGEYESMQAAADAICIDKKSIYNALHGMKNRNGYSFKYKEVV